MDELLLAGKFALTLVVPLLIALVPLMLFLFLSNRKPIMQSVGLTTLAAVCSSLTGLATPFLAFWVCAVSLSIGMPENGPKCVTGAAFFLAVGYLFTAVTVLIGLTTIIKTFIDRSRKVGY